MPISKLTSLPFPPPPTPPFSASGQGLVASVNQLIDTSVASLKSLPTNPQTDTVYGVIGFYAGTTSGGGQFVWNPTANKNTHNGGTIITPEAISAWNGTQADIATLLNWTGSGSGCWVRSDLQGFVTPEMFGAVGYSTIEDADSGVDNTICIQKAQKAGPLYPTAIYPVKNLQIEDGTRYVGSGSHLARSYDAFKSDAPMFSAHNSCTVSDKLIRCRDKKHWFVYGVNFDARGLCGAIEGGAFRPTMMNVGIRGANGDNLGDGLTPYTRGLHAVNVVIREASQDNIRNLVDSYIDCAFISDAGRHNINLQAGSNSNVFTNGKVEWCGQHGALIDECNNISFSGTIFDRSGHNAIRIRNSQIVTGNVILARSGKYAASPVSGQLDCHLAITGSDAISLHVVTKKFGDDGGSGYVSPRYSVSASGNTRNCVLYGDLSGCTIRPNYENLPDIDLTSCVGANQRPSGVYKAVPGMSSTEFALNSVSINTFEHYVVDLTVSSVNTTTGQEDASAFKVFVNRAAGDAFVESVRRYYVGPANSIDSTGSPTLLVSCSVNADGSELLVDITSASAQTHNMRVNPSFGGIIY